MNDSESPPTPAGADEDFLDSGLYDAPGAPAAEPSSAPPVGPSPKGPPVAGWKNALRPMAWLAAGVFAGAVAVAAWHSSESTTPAVNPTAAQGQLPGGGQPPNGQVPNGQVPNGQAPNGQVPNGQAPNGQVPNGQAPNGPPGFGGPAGGQPGAGPGFGGSGPGARTGEQHVSGTVTAVDTSSVTVRLTNGSTATYGVVASSDIVKNGARVSLSAIKPGDAVFLHVYPLNGHTVVEHLFAGPPPGSGDDSTTQSGATNT